MEHPTVASQAMLHVLLLALDLGGTFVFAISGAMVAVRHRLDVFGVLVLAFAAGNAGGITRDLLHLSPVAAAVAGGGVFRTALHGDPAWLAPAPRTTSGIGTPKNRHP